MASPPLGPDEVELIPLIVPRTLGPPESSLQSLQNQYIVVTTTNIESIGWTFGSTTSSCILGLSVLTLTDVFEKLLVSFFLPFIQLFLVVT